MPNQYPPLTTEALKETVEVYKRCGSQYVAAAELGIARTTVADRLRQAEKAGLDVCKMPIVPSGRETVTIGDGTVVVFGDCHYWPGHPSVAHRALVKLVRKLKPRLVICHGDAFDGASISRHPPIGWESAPTVAEELDVVRDRLAEIEKAAPNARRIWTLGNHDARFESRLAQVAPEFAEVHGIHLHDHIPSWDRAASVEINGSIRIQHFFKGGDHAAYNNAVKSGMSILTGHYHRATVRSFTDCTGTRYGVETGMIAPIDSNAFAYLLDRPVDWQEGFAVLTLRGGFLLAPELCTVVDRETVQFRGELIDV